MVITEVNLISSITEVEDKVISADGVVIRVEFKGTLCYTCGFYDYFEDYRVMPEEKGVYTEINSVEETDGGGIVEFQFQNYCPK